MCTPDRALWITYNGEVYNYIELRKELESCGHTFTTHTDTEVILHAYQQWGQGCVNRFNGMWAFAILDRKKGWIFCSRDRFGIKPLHYYHNGRHLVFASEIKQLLMFPFIRKRINNRMVYEYLAFNIVEHSSETFFSDISNLLPGHNLVFDISAQHLTTHRYYDPHYTINPSITLEESAGEFHRLLKESVRLRLRSDVKVGSCLSGGLDSSSIVCLVHNMLQEQGESNIQHTFSSHFEEKEANEHEYMETVIHKTGVKAHFTYPSPEGLLEELEHLIWHQEEPFGSTSIYAQWSVFKLAKENGVTVMLDGQGADELLAGYVPFSTNIYLHELVLRKRFLRLAYESWKFDTPLSQIIRPIVKNQILPMVSGQLIALLKKSPPLYRGLKTLKPQKHPFGGIETWLNTDLSTRYLNQSHFVANRKVLMFDEHEHLNNYLYQSTFLNNLQALLKYEDRNSMAFSVEGRVPFLDYRLVDFLFSLPSCLKMRNGFSKYVFRESMNGILPEEIRLRKTKLGFSTPETLWQKTILRPVIKQALDDPKLHTYVDTEKARLHLIRLHQTQQKDFSPWHWVNLSLWMKTFNLDPEQP